MTQDLPNTRVKGIALDYAIVRQEHDSRLKKDEIQCWMMEIMQRVHHTGHDGVARDRQG